MALGVYIYLYPELPKISDLDKAELQIPLKIYTSDGKLISEFGEIHRTKIIFEDIPEGLVNAYLAAEDDEFFSHTGIDFTALARALSELIITGEKGSGGGTLTMQVARNYLLTQEKTYRRKLKEIYTAFMLEVFLTKEEIFELYVNKVFKANNLTESQKVNVIAAFDKAETVKEVKLVFETVADNVVTKTAKSTIKESKLGMASKATGTTASKPEVISEVSDAVRRMQKLAGIIK